MAHIQIQDDRGIDYFRVSNQLIRRDGAELGVYAIATYCALVTFASTDSGLAYPSLNTLAKMLGCSKNTIVKAIEKLEESGWIKVVKQYDKKTKRHKTHIYHLLPPPDADKKSANIDEKSGPPCGPGVGHEMNQGGSPDEPGVDHEVNQGGSPDEPGGGSPDGTYQDSYIDQDSSNKKKTVETSSDVSLEAPDGASDDPPKPPIYESPGLYTVAEITDKTLKLPPKQWTLLLENEKADKARKTVIAHITAKFEARRREKMIEAMDRATVPNYDDPGMQASFQKVLKTLTTGPNGYTLEEINRFAGECPPVDKVFWLPNALSEWRNKSKKGQSNGRSATGTATDKPRRRRRYDRDDLAAWRQKHAGQQPAEQQATGQ